MPDDATDPGSDGMRAREAGHSVEDCPYRPGPQRTAWVVGWWIGKRLEVDQKAKVG